jgi:putative colanic acid biosynthesis acetyltransferase WcaF
MDQQMPPRIDLSRFNNDWYDIGASKFKWLLWFIANGMFVNTPLNPFNALRIFVLRAFGAKIGKGVVVKPRVNVKFPWKLEIGDNSWIGEAVWIEKQDRVTIGSNCCLSQGVVMMAGNHNYKKVTFDLMVKPIVLEDGVWLCTCSIVTQGVTCRSHAVLGVASVASTDLEAYTIYAGNPCREIRKRVMETE